MPRRLLYSLGHSIFHLSDKPAGRIGLASAVGFAGGALAVALDELTETVGVGPHVMHIVDACTIGVFLGLLTYIEVSAITERRRRLVEELRTVAELNHVLRNSLQSIQYAAKLSADDKYVQIINDCVQRIDLKLHELFPIVVDPRETTRGATKKTSV